MSDTASLEISRELFEISGWATTEFYHTDIHSGLPRVVSRQIAQGEGTQCIPAYGAGYLLRKLPTHYNDQWLRLAPITDDMWSAYYIQSGVKTAGQDEWSDTPADALCKLAIELHKAGILPISGRD